jgi:peptidyl-dipeptidase Dcp
MKGIVILSLFVVAVLVPKTSLRGNPFLEKWDTPFVTPPFDAIKHEHYLPAFEEGMEQQRREISAIVRVRSVPTFENTVEAFERSGELLDRVSNVFFALNSSLHDDGMQEIANEVSPALSKHRDEILLDDLLFQKSPNGL